MRAVIDTNVWISALLNPHGAPARVMEAFRAGRFTVVLSQPLLNELRQVLMRPRLRQRFGYSAEMVRDLEQLLIARAIWVLVEGHMEMCRDPRDNMVLETALRGQANYLVTRDDDLKRDIELIRKMAELGVQVVSVQQFLNLFDS